MTYRWLTFFSVLPVLAATVSGTVELTDAKVKSWDGVVVWLEPLQGKPVLTAGRVVLGQIGGIHDDRESDLVGGQNGRNRTGGANVEEGESL